MLLRRRHPSAGLLVCLCMLICSVAFAAPIGTVLPPSGTVPYSVLAPAPGTLEASSSTPFSYNTGGGNTNTGSLIQAVFLRGGTLDFYFQVVLTGGVEPINEVDSTV